MLNARRLDLPIWPILGSSRRSRSPNKSPAHCRRSPHCPWRAPWIEAIPMTIAPNKVTVRTYHVGFGDCFLLSFQYPDRKERHVLIDFGSTGVPPGTKLSKRMLDIANDIKRRSKGKLHAVV